jgi:hypothetical protein
MAVDLDQIFKSAIAAASGQLQSGAPAVQNYLQTVMQNHKAALLQLAQQRLNNQISDQDLKDELDDEKIALAAELQATKTIAAVVAQNAANAAIAALQSAVSAAVKV